MKSRWKRVHAVFDRATVIVDRVDWIGWIAIVVGVFWGLFSVLGEAAPLLAQVSAGLELALLGFISLQISRIVLRLTAEPPAVELLFGNHALHHEATELIRTASPDASIWSTSMNFADRGATSEHFRRYFEALLTFLRQPEAELFRAVAFGRNTDADELRSDFDQLLALPHKNWRVKYFRANPMTVDVFLSDKAAIIGFPQRATFPHLAGGLIVRDGRLISLLHDWYRDYIWGAGIANDEPRSAQEFETLVAS